MIICMFYAFRAETRHSAFYLAFSPGSYISQGYPIPAIPRADYPNEN